MRIAIGASRARLIRQVLTENLVLAVAGSAVGILLAAIGVRLAAPFWPAGLPRATDIAVDWSVVAFCVCLALVTAVAIALPTVLRLSRADISESLKTGSWGNTPANEWVRSGLVVAQVALGLMLLCAATLVLEGFRHLVQRDAGFQPDHLLSFAVSLPGEAYADGRQEIFMGQLLERLAGVPGVTAVAAGSPLPLSGDQMAIAFGIEGRPTAPSDRPTANMAIVTPGFFQTIGTPLEDGRGFTDRDDGRAPAVLIVNRAFADRFFPGERGSVNASSPAQARTTRCRSCGKSSASSAMRGSRRSASTVSPSTTFPIDSSPGSRRRSSFARRDLRPCSRRRFAASWRGSIARCRSTTS